MKKLMTQVSLGVILGLGTIVVPTVLTRPAIAQQLTSATPTGAEVPANSSITWKFDNTTLVDANSLKIFVDGVDVTAQSVIDLQSNTFGYKPSKPFTVGTHNVEVRFKNTRGISYKANWSFEVTDVTLAITAVYHNATTEPLETGEEFRVEVRGTPKATAQVLLIQNGSTVRTLTPTETSTGVYKASFPITSRDQVNEGIVVARLARSGRVMFRTVETPFALNPRSTTPTGSVTQTVVDQSNTSTNTSTNPLTLDITSHKNGDLITSSNGFDLKGTTLPDATVKVTAISEAPTVGGFLRIGSATKLLDQVEADVQADGTFSIRVPRPGILNAGMTYTITVEAKHGEHTQTVNLTLKQR